MEDFLESLFGELLEGFVDVVDTASTSDGLPVGLKIASAVMLFLFLGGALGGIIFAGIMLVKEDAALPGVVMFAIAAFILGYLIFKFNKIFKTAADRGR